MGSVLAASAPPPPLPSPDFSPSPAKQDASPVSTAWKESPGSLQNPGTIEDLHKKCKDVFPVNFEGAKLMLTKGLSNHFQISHTIIMNSVSQSGYRFGATYIGMKQLSPTEAYPVLLGDVDSSGNLNANIIHQFGSRIKGKLAAQVQKNQFTAVQMTSDYLGDACTLSLTVGNPDPLNASGIMVMHYLQSLTPSLALGAELAHQRNPSLPDGHVTVLSAVGRYVAGDSTISGNIGMGGCHVCFHQQATPTLQVGVELEVSTRMQDSVATIAYQMDLPKVDVVFRGSVDSNWTVGAVLEKKLQPLPFLFALSGTVNHKKHQFRLGCGLIIG